MIVRVALAAVVAIAVAGCGDDSSSQTTTTAAETQSVRVYFLLDGKVWPAAREIEKTGAFQVDDQLRRGLTEDEKKLGLTTEVTGDEMNLSRAALAQLVYTSTQFDPTESVEINGKTYTRADFEKQTPLILVESPLAFEHVTSPLDVTGTANTFEATFDYELRNPAGKLVDTNFVTATSGTGTRGTFDFTTKKVGAVGSLTVFERSAKDGSRIHEVQIPLTASR